MSHIVLVEDSAEYQLLVRHTLQAPDIQLSIVKTLSEARAILNRLDSQPIDLILLDLHLSDGDGLTLLSEIHRDPVKSKIAIILLTGTSDVQLKVQAFEWGADDYLVKPVSPLELRARVFSKLAKLKQLDQSKSEHLQKGKLHLDQRQMLVRIEQDGKTCSIDLTHKELRLLFFLAQNEGKILSRSEILKAVWNNSAQVLDRTVDAHLYALRKKLKSAANYIEAVPRMGYRFDSNKEV